MGLNGKFPLLLSPPLWTEVESLRATLTFCGRVRALSSGPPNLSTSPPSPLPPVNRYKLAEHRYGREEMLVLYNKDSRPPDDILSGSPHIVLEKIQPPLSLLQMSDEEMVRSINFLTFCPVIVQLHLHLFIVHMSTMSL